jgi:hypothetical protein
MPKQKDQHSLSSPHAIFQSAPINQTMVKNTHTKIMGQLVPKAKELTRS